VFPRASCGSGTMAFSPIAIVPSTWAPVGPPSMPPCSGACRTRNRRVLPLSGARGQCQPLPALWPRTAAPDQSPPLSSGHRPTLSAMGGLNRCASTLRRRLRTAPQPALRPRPPLTLSRPLTILHHEPKPGVRARRLGHDQHAKPPTSRPRRPSMP
jgi:hypothetical protein